VERKAVRIFEFRFGLAWRECHQLLAVFKQFFELLFNRTFCRTNRHKRDGHDIADRYSGPLLYVFVYQQEGFPLPGDYETFK